MHIKKIMIVDDLPGVAYSESLKNTVDTSGQKALERKRAQLSILP